jgi:hypothetical protein
MLLQTAGSLGFSQTDYVSAGIKKQSNSYSIACHRC